MDINIKITLDETPALMTSLDCLYEVLRAAIGKPQVVTPAEPEKAVSVPTAKTETPQPEAEPAPKVVAPAAAPKPETPKSDKLTEDELVKLRTCTAAFFHKTPDKTNMKTMKKWLMDNHVPACSVKNIKRDQLPDLLKLFPDDVRQMWEVK